MARFIFGTLAVIATLAFLIVFEGGDLLNFLMLSPFLVVVLVPAFAVLAVWSPGDWKRAWQDALARPTGSPRPSAADSAELWAFHERTCYLASVLGFIMGLVIILSNLRELSTIGRPLAAGLMTPIYAILFGIVARILGARVERSRRA
jgi:flagellar motor component MotA